MRIASLTCSNTEIVATLGRGDWLVGVDSYSDWPADLVADLPRLGKDLDIDVDRLAALEPDLVLASLTVPGHEQVVEAVAEAGLDYVAPAPTSLEGVYADILHLGDLLDAAPRAREVVAGMRRAMPAVEVEDRPAILVEWWPKPVIVPGAKSWVSDLIRLAGGRNPFEEHDGESTAVDAAAVVAAAPDAAVVCWCGVEPDKYRPELVRERAGWQDTPALRHDRVHTIPEAYLGRPGPRLVEGYRALREVVAACG